ncbi:UbiA family prenyltransferase [Rubritalea sp.]|uniref:UbiA family prenyltransferase n=1 Tax=Rubritalea sp. TaxID=2109375 RepID=UPI003EF9E31F
MSQQSKLSAILATGRISNLPTVWCNVLVAFLIVQLPALQLSGIAHTTFSLTLLIATCLAASCLYVGGCFLGDAVDVEFDLAHKPDRPIPMGRLTRQSVYTWATTLISTGVILPSAYLYLSSKEFYLYPLLASLALAGVIIAYSLWHKRSPWIGLPLIGACRFFLVIFGASIAVNQTPIESAVGTLSSSCIPFSIYFFASAVGIYTICFASVARSESSPNPITWRKVLISVMLLLPLIAQPTLGLYSWYDSNAHLHDTYYILFKYTYVSIAALLLYLIWMVAAFRKINTNKGKFVSMSLAGFCLLDACFASFFGVTWLIVCLILFIISLTLQKWAPAT